MSAPKVDQVEAKKAVVDKVHELINTYNKAFGTSITVPEIRFDKKGKTAGCVSYRNNHVFMNFNLFLLIENFSDFIKTVVPHEVSHYCVYSIYGHEYTRSGRRVIHGKNWKSAMRFFGVDPNRCHNYDTSCCASRRLNYFVYRCECSEHKISSILHNRIKNGKNYRCTSCKSRLHYVKSCDD